MDVVALRAAVLSGGNCYVDVCVFLAGQQMVCFCTLRLACYDLDVQLVLVLDAIPRGLNGLSDIVYLDRGQNTSECVPL